MFLRLAFAISTSIEPEIIIMDEMIGAGDARFVARARARLTGLLERSRILVLASHEPTILKAFCTQLVWLEKGCVRAVGDVDSVYRSYLSQMNEPEQSGG